MMLRRLVVISLTVAMLCATIPAPAGAGTSTGTEVQIGKDTDKQVTDSTNVVTDPLLNAWVNEVTQKLWAQVARKDVPYNIKILDDPSPNAFSTLGGYVYVNEATLDFVQSDDELAGVLGHETGHLERRHAVTTANKANILNVVLGVGSLFSPFLYRFGQFIQAGAIAKMERINETEADKYGLLLMGRAGYDPEAMVSFMMHFNTVFQAHNGLLDKYLADHPDWPNRISHLMGYEQLDPKTRTDDQREAAALHNLDEARYSIAARQFAVLSKSHPDNTALLYHLGEAQLAVGQTAKGEQNLAAAAAKGTPQTRTAALGRIAALRDTEKRLNLARPNVQPLRDAVAQAQTNETAAATAITSRRDSGRDQLKAMTSRIQNIAYQIPDFSRINPRKGGRLDAVLHNLTTMGRSLNTGIGHAQEAIGGVGSLERNKEGGLLKENADILNEMGAAVKLDAAPPQALATFAYYPRMLANTTAAGGDMVRAVDAARASLAMLDIGLGDLDKFVRLLPRMQLDVSGDIGLNDYKTLETPMAAAAESLNKAAVAASQASQLLMMARSRQLETRIDMLGLASSPDRYATLQHALEVRFHNAPMSYDAMLRADLSPGQVAASSVVAADTNVSPAVIQQEAKATHRAFVDVANGRGMHAEALEIMLGLVWLDYSDDPDKEARGRT
ncbi:MAG: M48 family metalloprotease [Candidatus Velthaea sp.]